MATIDISAIISEFGAKYTDEGQMMKDIKKQLFAQSETEKFFGKRPHKDDTYKSGYATIDEVVQAFAIPFVAKSTLVFQPWETKLGEFKIDQLFTPDNFRGSWLGFMAEIKKVDRSKWPILKWYIQQMLLPRSEEDLEQAIAYRGWMWTGINAVPTVNGTTLVRERIDETTVGLNTKANGAMNGIHAQIVKMVQASRAVVIATGALNADPATFCGQIEDWVEAMQPELRAKCDFVFMSEANVNKYMDGVRAKYNANYKQEDSLVAIKNSRLKVQSLRSMDASDNIWATPANNRIMPIHADNTGKFDVQKSDRSVKLLTDYKKTLAFDVPEFVVTNDLENTISAGDITNYYS